MANLATDANSGVRQGRRHTWLLQWTAPYMEVMGVKSTTCTSPWKLGSRTICLAVPECTLMTLLLPRLSTLHPYSCTHTQGVKCLRGQNSDARSATMQQ